MPYRHTIYRDPSNGKYYLFRNTATGKYLIKTSETIEPLLYDLHYTGETIPIGTSGQDPYWTVEAWPNSAANKPSLPYSAFVFSGGGGQQNVPTNWFPGAPSGRYNVGISGARWIGANNNDATSLIPDISGGTYGNYNVVYSTTFTAESSGTVLLSFRAAPDNKATFFVNGGIDGTSTNTPTITGGSQIGSTVQGLGTLKLVAGQVPVNSGTNKLYAVVQDIYSSNNVYGYTGFIALPKRLPLSNVTGSPATPDWCVSYTDLSVTKFKLTKNYQYSITGSPGMNNTNSYGLMKNYPVFTSCDTLTDTQVRIASGTTPLCVKWHDPIALKNNAVITVTSGISLHSNKDPVLSGGGYTETSSNDFNIGQIVTLNISSGSTILVSGIDYKIVSCDYTDTSNPIYYLACGVASGSVWPCCDDRFGTPVFGGLCQPTGIDLLINSLSGTYGTNGVNYWKTRVAQYNNVAATITSNSLKMTISDASSPLSGRSVGSLLTNVPVNFISYQPVLVGSSYEYQQSAFTGILFEYSISNPGGGDVFLKCGVSNTETLTDPGPGDIVTGNSSVVSLAGLTSGYVYLSLTDDVTNSPASTTITVTKVLMLK